MLAWIDGFGWLVCVVYSTIPCYWLMVHPFAKRWRTRPNPYKVLLPLWMSLWIVLGVLTWRWHSAALYSSAWTWIPAGLLLLLGIRLYAASGGRFSRRMLVGEPELSPASEQRLVTGGIRARVRHPVYAAHLCEMLAWSVGTGLAVCYALTAFAVLSGMLMIRQEDLELGRRFGEEFSEYRRRVPAVLPRLPSRMHSS